MSTCVESQPCYPQEFYAQILCFLSKILTNLDADSPGGVTGVRYDWELLCNPSNGNPVFVRYAYKTDGTFDPVTDVRAFLPDGTAYSGIVSQLLACSGGGGGGSPGGPVRYDYEVLCNPVNGLPVLIQIPYNIDGTVGTYLGFNPDGTAFVGSLTTLIACTSSVAGTTRYDYEFLCSPTTGLPVSVRAAYDINGTQSGFAAYNLDGTAYVGNISLLISCASGDVIAPFNGFSWTTLCDPTTSRVVFVRVSYNSGGTPTAIDGFYGDLSAYTGDPYDLVNCVQLTQGGGGGGDAVQNWHPNASSAIIANPGVGLQTVQKNLIATNAAGSNPNNYPFRNENYRSQWTEVEDTDVQGNYDFTTVNQVFDDAAAADQIINYRFYTYDPSSGYASPNYAYNIAGWRNTDANGPGTFNNVYWGNATVRGHFLSLLTALSNQINTHPAFGSFDCGWGDFDENNYSGSAFDGTLTGGAPNPGVGNELPDLSLAQVQLYFDMRRTTFGNSRIMLTSIDDQNSFDYPVGTLGFGARTDGWGFRPSVCPAGGVHMCTLAPATMVPPGTFPNGWQTAERILETYGRLYSGSGNWVTAGYDWQSSFNWATSPGKASELNVKGQFAPPASSPNMKGPFETMLNTLGYRYVLSNVTRPVQTAAGAVMNISTTFSNTGNCPNYRDHVLAFRLYDPNTGLKYYEKTPTVTSAWAAGSTVVNASTITVPTWFPATGAQLSVGLVKPTNVVAGIIDAFIPDINLANDGNVTDFWYHFPTATQITNAAPTATPTTVYAATFNGTTQFLSSSSPLFRLNATDFVISVALSDLDTSATRAFVSKGTVGTAATMEYWVGYDQPTDRIVAKFSNGATVYSAVANNFGNVSAFTVSAATPLKVLVEFNNTSKILAISVNSSLSNTVTGTGSIAAGSNTFRIGNDSSSNFLDGQATEVGIWHRLFTGLGLTDRQLLLNSRYVRLTDMPHTIRYGNYYYWEMTEASGSRIDSRCGRALTDNGTVTRTALN